MATNGSEGHAKEIAQGERFAFGKNWQRFLESLDDARIEESVHALQSMLGKSDLAGYAFLDVGCGSGLSSLAAYRMGAKVHSFDYDPDSVRCTEILRDRYCVGSEQAERWTIEQGSILDTDYVSTLNQFDIVYSWGVLHHTGDMRLAFEHVIQPLKPDGCLFIAIYNDQGLRSKLWHSVKRVYCSGVLGRTAVSCIFLPYFFLRAIAVGVLKYGSPVGEFRNYRSNRGMSIYHDWIDWLGGYPYEVASAESIKEHFEHRGFQLKKEKLTRRLGCNELVFVGVAETRTDN